MQFDQSLSKLAASGLMRGHVYRAEEIMENMHAYRRATWAAAWTALALIVNVATASADEGEDEGEIAVPNAAMIDTTPCGDRNDFLRLDIHFRNGFELVRGYMCFADSGTEWLGTVWVDKLSTGNNRVQWYGDGRWQPEVPIEPWTTFVWPNHPGGVRLEAVRIL